MKSSTIRRLWNRWLQLVARWLPGGRSVRPLLHRLRRVEVGAGVFIGEDVVIENEFPERVEIQDNVQIALRAIIMAHLCQPGRVIIEREAYIGPNSVIAAADGRTLRIGEGAVVGAGSVVTSDVAPRTFVRPSCPEVVARVSQPLASATSYADFLRGLEFVRPDRKGD